MPYLIEAIQICKTFHVGISPINVLNDITFRVGRGEFIAVMGASGSGKSTLLHILGCLDRPTSGTYMLNHREVSRISDKELSLIRATSIGFVFQTFNLLPQLNVYENVRLPFLYSSCDDPDADRRAIKAIEQVGLLHRLKHRPAELSGGEMQRVAIARAIGVQPILILADEPTGNLDSKTGVEILNIFQNLNESGATIVMITHDPEVANRAQKKLILKDGEFRQ